MEDKEKELLTTWVKAFEVEIFDFDSFSELVMDYVEIKQHFPTSNVFLLSMESFLDRKDLKDDEGLQMTRMAVYAGQMVLQFRSAAQSSKGSLNKTQDNSIIDASEKLNTAATTTSPPDSQPSFTAQAPRLTVAPVHADYIERPAISISPRSALQENGGKALGWRARGVISDEAMRLLRREEIIVATLKAAREQRLEAEAKATGRREVTSRQAVRKAVQSTGSQAQPPPEGLTSQSHTTKPFERIYTFSDSLNQRGIRVRDNYSDDELKVIFPDIDAVAARTKFKSLSFHDKNKKQMFPGVTYERAHRRFGLYRTFRYKAEAQFVKEHGYARDKYERNYQRQLTEQE